MTPMLSPSVCRHQALQYSGIYDKSDRGASSKGREGPSDSHHLRIRLQTELSHSCIDFPAKETDNKPKEERHWNSQIELFKLTIWTVQEAYMQFNA